MALIDELKERRAEVVAELETQEAFVVAHQICVEDKRTEIADLDRAIAALTPAPAPVEIEIPEGFTKWEGGEWTGNLRDKVQVVFESGAVSGGSGDAEAVEDIASWWHWPWDGKSDRIIAYRIIEAAPVADEQDDASEFGDPDRPVYGDGLAYGDGNDDRINNVPFDLNPYDGKEAEYWNNGWNDADAAIKLNEPAEHISILTGDPAIEPESGLHEERPALNEAMQDERGEPVELPQPEWNDPQPTEGYAPVTNPAADEAAKAFDWYDPKAVHERQKFNPFGIFRREPEDA